jgi:methionine-rich copper-binding protein CopC
VISSTRRARRLSLATLAMSVLAALAVLSPAAPASAHDQLVSSDPAADSVVTAMPAEITLTYSAELLGDAGSNVVQVTDAAGTQLADGTAIVDGTSVVQALTGEASGTLTVLWRVVSSDGHPISGEFAFTVEGPATPTPTPTPEGTTLSPTPEPRMTTMTTPTDTASPAPSPEEAASGNPLPWIVGILVLLAVIGVVLYLLVIRPRRTADSPSADSRPGADD